jgi:hypothetical protein
LVERPKDVDGGRRIARELIRVQCGRALVPHVIDPRLEESDEVA